MAEIESKMISIPNIVCNTKGLELGAKYLYGYIRYWDYNDEFVKTTDEICKELEISESTLRKYLKHLKDLNFISIKISVDNRHRIIKPLVTDGIMLVESERAKERRRVQHALMTQSVVAEAKLNRPAFLDDFLNAIKNN